MIDIKVFNVTFYYTNCYLLTDTATGDMAIVDPGNKSEALVEQVEKSDGKVKYIIFTHGHYDHIGYGRQLAERYGAKIICGKNANPFLSDNVLNHSYCHNDIRDLKPFNADILLEDNDTFNLGETEIKFISTPGHTVGCGCYIFDDVIISGDMLFKDSYGRTDLPTGDFNQLVESMKKVKNLKGDYIVYPGHGESTTLSYERKYNPLMSNC